MKVILWADASCAAESVRQLGSTRLAGIVGAANRPGDWPALAAFAAVGGVPFLVLPFRDDPCARQSFLARLAHIAPDWQLVNSYSMILPAECLAVPRLGTLNLHGGILPEYRGANVLNWVLINGETETGITVHFMDEGVDTGDIVLQERLPIEIDDTARTLQTKMSQLWPNMVANAARLIESGACPRQPQDERRARHWPRRRPADGRIDWRWSAERIYNLIRALVAPWPGAFFEAKDDGRVTLDAFHSLEKVRELQERYAAPSLRLSA